MSETARGAATAVAAYRGALLLMMMIMERTDMTRIVATEVSETQVTIQSVKVGEKGRWQRFLRQVIKDNDQRNERERWIAVAFADESPQDGVMRLEFMRLKLGAPGQPNQVVRVKTDMQIPVYGVSGDRGEHNTGAPLMCVTGLSLESYNTRVLVWLLRHHMMVTLGIAADHGSPNTQAAGLHFYECRIYQPGIGSLQLGPATIAQHDQILCEGVVEVRRNQQGVAR